MLPYNHIEIQYIFLLHEKQGQASSMQTLIITHHLASLCIRLQEPTCLCPVIFVNIIWTLALYPLWLLTVTCSLLSPPLSHCFIFARSSWPNLVLLPSHIEYGIRKINQQKLPPCRISTLVLPSLHCKYFRAPVQQMSFCPRSHPVESLHFLGQFKLIAQGKSIAASFLLTRSQTLWQQDLVSIIKKI